VARSFKNLHPQVCSLENVMAAARFHARWETQAVRLDEELGTTAKYILQLIRDPPEFFWRKAVPWEGKSA